MWNSSHSTMLPRPNPSLSYQMPRVPPTRYGTNSSVRKKAQRSSSWAQWNNTVKIPSLKRRWQSVYSNIYSVIYQSQQTIIRLSWVSFFLERSCNVLRCPWCCVDESVPAFSFQTRSIFHCSFIKSFSFFNYNTIDTQYTNQYIQRRARSYTKQW